MGSEAFRRICWVDGALVPVERAAVRADDSAFVEGRGCYTSVRVAGGRARHLERHITRLQQGAVALRLGVLDAGAIRTALDELTRAVFTDGEGIVRLQATRDGDGAIHLIGLPRPLGVDPPEWSAIVVRLAHDGASLAGGQKVTSRLTLALAAEDASDAGVDEAVLLDSAGRVIEGSRSNLFVVTPSGSLLTPPIDAGAVAGIARSICLARVDEAREANVSKRELLAAAELVAVNAVRGARPITRLDDRPVGDGRAGPWSERLAEALAAD